jgi:hypothetical protein
MTGKISRIRRMRTRSGRRICKIDRDKKQD